MTLASIPSRPLSIGFLTPHNPFDRRAFSGTTFFAYRALAAHPGMTVRLLGGHRPRHLTDRLFRRKPTEVDPDRLDVTDLDAVVGLVASSLLDPLSERYPELPFVHVTDATPAFLRTFYGWAVPRSADEREARIAARASAVVYSSDIMAARAPDDLCLPGLDPASVPFGVNIEHLPENRPAMLHSVPVRLLFIGLDWERKGGDVAVATLDRLLERGVPAELTIIGRCPERHRDHPAITYAGFLNKNRRSDARRFNTALTKAHLLLAPSRGDCTPMVIAEAMSHGTPVLATDTGGIAALIGGEGAGRVMPEFAAPEAWAKAVTEITSDPNTYTFMADAAFDRARHVLTWSAWAREIEAIARRVIAPAVPRQVTAA